MGGVLARLEEPCLTQVFAAPVCGESQEQDPDQRHLGTVVQHPHPELDRGSPRVRRLHRPPHPHVDSVLCRGDVRPVGADTLRAPVCGLERVVAVQAILGEEPRCSVGIAVSPGLRVRVYPLLHGHMRNLSRTPIPRRVRDAGRPSPFVVRPDTPSRGSVQ